jgi:hypothetical protein
MNQEQAIIELRKALEAITKLPFVTPAAYILASRALKETKQTTEWITNDGFN